MRTHASTEIHFSRAAAVYHCRAELQRSIAGKLLSHLSRPLQAPRVLELGCGTGFLTYHLLHSLSPVSIDAVDISSAMIDQARRTLGSDDRIHWYVRDIWDYQPSGDYDLIASSSSLQWMQPLDALFPRLAGFLKPEGRLLCSLMVDGTLGELHRLRREIAPRKCPRYPLPTVDATLAGLRDAGFRVSTAETETLRTVYDSVEDLLRSIRELGFTGGPLATSSPLLTRGELKRLTERYATACAAPGGGVAANYVVYSFEAVKTLTS